MKGILAPRLSVAFSGGPVIFSGLGVSAAAFVLVATPTMHHFWAAPGDRQQETDRLPQGRRAGVRLDACLGVLALLAHHS